jgi:hypothetical protein
MLFFQVILKQVDETFTDEELNGIISDVSISFQIPLQKREQEIYIKFKM